jgi:hypothetical protein
VKHLLGAGNDGLWLEKEEFVVLWEEEEHQRERERKRESKRVNTNLAARMRSL